MERRKIVPNQWPLIDTSAADTETEDLENTLTLSPYNSTESSFFISRYIFIFILFFGS